MSTKHIVVTGSNRGIGLGIIQLLAKTQHQPPLTIHATSRSGTDLGIPTSHNNVIRYSKLDIGDKQSITSFLETTSKDGQNIDVLINNSGVNNNNNETPELATQTIDVNYRGTRSMCKMFLDHGGMAQNKGARIVNVSSTACQLNNYAPSVQERFRAVKSLSDVDALADSYLSAVQGGNTAQQDAGWGSGAKSYQVSKALINALTVVLAQQNPDVLVNCCCPGWVDTDMGHQIGRPPKTLEEGARVPVRLAIGELGSAGDQDGNLGKGSERVSGRYFGNDGVSDRGWGQAREW
ncbi:NAD(P)-binding protein [Phaeosphaeriaceae sp. SRC1lsM3a]|nr:NAD(P)-binding protein [Stagonospora sp. SRC1lsM3a]